MALEKNADPVFSNNAGNAMIKFTNDYIEEVQNRFGTKNMSSEEIKQFAQDNKQNMKKKGELTEKEFDICYTLQHLN